MRCLLLAQQGRLDNETDLLNATEEACGTVQLVRTVDDLITALRQTPEAPAIVVADMMSTIFSPEDQELDGYRDFARRMHEQRKTTPIELIMISPRKGETEVFFGWAGFIDAYISQPVDPDLLRNYIGRIIKDNSIHRAGENP